MAVQSSTNLFRRLAWNASVPLEIRLANAPGVVESCFLTAPRHSYLALLLPQIRAQLVELALDEDQIAALDESQWWFEVAEEEGAFAVGAVRWHWPIDLIDLQTQISRPAPPAASETPARPLRLLLHLSNPPTDKLPIAPGIDSVRTHFVSQVKEADFVRWGNTKRVTSLRRADLEAGWEGVEANDYDTHSRLSTRVVPLPLPTNSTPPTSSLGPGSRPPSTEPGGKDKLESAYAARSLPIKLYLPDGAPALQVPVPPLSDGKPTTLGQMLASGLPLLFGPGKALAQPIILGISVPLESEVAWLAACMSGADGWLRIGVRLVAEL